MKYKCRYYVVRYVASPIRDEAINIGVILNVEGSTNYLSRFTKDLSSLDASQTDKKIIKKYIEEWHRNLRTLKLSPFGKLQITEARGCMTDDIESEIETLYKMFIGDTGALYKKGYEDGKKEGRLEIIIDAQCSIEEVKYESDEFVRATCNEITKRFQKKLKDST